MFKKKQKQNIQKVLKNKIQKTKIYEKLKKKYWLLKRNKLYETKLFSGLSIDKLV